DVAVSGPGPGHSRPARDQVPVLVAAEPTRTQELHHVLQSVPDTTSPVGILDLKPSLLLGHRLLDLLWHHDPELLGPGQPRVRLEDGRTADEHVRTGEVRR